METRTLEVPDLPEDLLARLDERVLSRGGSLADYVRFLIEKDLGAKPPHAGMTFAEILAPARGWGDASDPELEDFIEAEVRAYRSEKRKEQAHG